ncbi:MAG: M6 family metalloprotease domain-containing protein, partial [Candidatus Desantisbacteria bacterium]
QTFLSVFLMCGLVCSWLLLLTQTVFATPPLYPGIGAGHKDDVAPMHYRMEEGEGRLLAPGDWGIGNQVSTTDPISVIALLVEFNDVKFAKNRAYFEGLMDRFVQYYRDNSYGKLAINYTIAAATVTLNNSLSDYGLSDNNTLVEDAVEAADGNVNFSKYDALIVIHAGQGEESNRTVADIYSRFTYNSIGIANTTDGAGVYGACIVPEHEGNSASPFGIFCHEFGHQLGLPDLYDITDRSEGIGVWSLMASGAYNGSGLSPSHFDAWCKVKLDWVTPQTVTTTLIHENIPQAETNPVVYKLWNNTMDSEEYFLVENRQDAYLPGKGLLIWHVDDGQQTNADPSHYLVALEQADGARELERDINRGDIGDPYPGSKVNRYFDNWSNPNSRSYSGTSTYIAVTNISNSAATMIADLSVVPSSINLIGPLDNDVLLTSTPTFFWTAIEGVGTYTLFVGTRSFIATTTHYHFNTPLEENASYTWKVTANATNTSTTWCFWINAINESPSAFGLLSPINGQTISQQTPTFRWQASTDPDPMD